MSKAQIETYRENITYLKGKEYEIYKAIERLQPTTLTEVKEYTNFQHQTVSSRISTLYNRGLIKIIGKKYTPRKGKKSRPESLYMICSIQERKDRQNLIKFNLEERIKDHTQAVAILGERTPQTSELLTQQIQKHKNTINRLKN